MSSSDERDASVRKVPRSAVLPRAAKLLGTGLKMQRASNSAQPNGAHHG